MSPPRKTPRQKRGRAAGNQLVEALVEALRAGGRWLMEFGRDSGQLLIRPTDTILRLGQEKSWRFSIAVFISFVLVMQLWSWLALCRFAPDTFPLKVALEAWFKQTLASWLILPLALFVTTWAGLALFHQQLKLFQTANLVALVLIPLMAGCVLAGLVLDLRLGNALFAATLIFSLLVSLGYFSAALQLLLGLEGPQRIYLPPLVYAVAYLALQLILALLFSRPAS